ncbi:MAG TPA: urease accessory protein UreD [Verrucomicrobiae bacterium]|nr:urease accessory protein UreD [Verrucomicrobiae bacterium]
MRLHFQDRGRAALEVEQVFNQSTVTTSFATNPMKLLTPRSRGQCVCTYASNFGGGLVAGDQTRLDLRVGAQARCFLGTQASTKVYRNPHRLPCGHATSASIEAGGLLVFAPAPVQPFAQSSYEQRQQFELGPEAGLVLLDWFTAGRAACGERWSFAHFSTRNEVWRKPARGPDGVNHELDKAGRELLFVDASSLDESEGPLNARHRTGRFNCFAMLLLIGAPVQEAAKRALLEVQHLGIKRRQSLLACASPLQDGTLLRLAGEEVAEVEQSVRRYLAPVAECLGDDPWSRRN